MKHSRGSKQFMQIQLVAGWSSVHTSSLKLDTHVLRPAARPRPAPVFDQFDFPVDAGPPLTSLVVLLLVKARMFRLKDFHIIFRA